MLDATLVDIQNKQGRLPNGNGKSTNANDGNGPKVLPYTAKIKQKKRNEHVLSTRRKTNLIQRIDVKQRDQIENLLLSATVNHTYNNHAIYFSFFPFRFAFNAFFSFHLTLEMCLLG